MSSLPQFLLAHPHIRRSLGIADPPFRAPTRLVSHLNPDFTLQPYALSDENEWQKVRSSNRDWLTPWDSTDPLNSPSINYKNWITLLSWDLLRGNGIAFTMRFHGVLVGEISLGAMNYGALRSAIVGYWVSHDAAGNGFAPLALAMVADWAFFAQTGPHLNRLEVDLIARNARSRRVVEKNGFSYCGRRRAWMHVAGQWQDHEIWDLCAADVLGVPAQTYQPLGREVQSAAVTFPCETRLSMLANQPSR